MNATAQQTEPNTHEMVVIHRIFRREFPLLAGIVPRAPDGDTRRAAPIARHIELLPRRPAQSPQRRGRVPVAGPAGTRPAARRTGAQDGSPARGRGPAQRASEAADRTLAGHPRPPGGNQAGRDAIGARRRTRRASRRGRSKHPPAGARAHHRGGMGRTRPQVLREVPAQRASGRDGPGPGIRNARGPRPDPRQGAGACPDDVSPRGRRKYERYIGRVRGAGR